MQGQSSPVQVKDPYTGSILMHVGSSCKHTGVYNISIPIPISISLYTAIRPRGHSRQGCAWSVSIRQFKRMKI